MEGVSFRFWIIVLLRYFKAIASFLEAPFFLFEWTSDASIGAEA